MKRNQRQWVSVGILLIGPIGFAVSDKFLNLSTFLSIIIFVPLFVAAVLLSVAVSRG